MNNESKLFKRVTVSIISFWLVLFVFLPNILILVISFFSRDEADLVALKFTFSNYYKVIDPVYFVVFKDSIYMALVSTVLCLVVAFPFTYVLSRIRSNVKNILLLLIIVPFWTSALIRTYAIKIIITDHGLINTFLLKIGVISQPITMIYTEGAVILGFVYTLLPFMILPLYASMEKLDYRYIEAASDLGANKIQTFMKIVIPLTAPGAIAGSLLVFLPALGLFYVADLLGGAKGLLVGNLIRDQFVGRVLDWPFGAAVSTVLTILMGLLLLANYHTVKAASKGGSSI